jgi:ABC-type sugar transport system ATPase subunit
MSVIAEQFILEARNITKSFGSTKVLKDVNFGLRKGEVHALLGANGAGKSTLMNILDGIITDYEGSIFVEGKEVHMQGPDDARLNGIGMVHQELSVLPNISVAENIYMNRLPKNNLGFVDWKKLYDQSRSVLKSIGMDIDPAMKLSGLTVADRQMVEIARIVSLDAPVILLDEPTSALSEAEIKRMLELIKQFKAEGRSVVFITHKLGEILAVSDRITVLRDGQVIKVIDVEKRDKDAEQELVRLMIGESAAGEDNMFPGKGESFGDITLETENLSGTGGFENISFYARSGEVVVLTGLKGAKRTEFLRAVFGADKYTSGNVRLFGKPHKKGIRASVSEGMVMVTEDRKGEGIVPLMSIKDNISLATISDCSCLGLISSKKVAAKARRFVEKLSIKIGSLEQSVSSLSGGNQQKVVLSKWMASNPRVFLLDEPTRGIDIGSKIEIYKLIREIANEGATVVVVSSEIPEAMGLADRMYIMREGEMVGELKCDEINNDVIMRMMFGHKKEA